PVHACGTVGDGCTLAVSVVPMLGTADYVVACQRQVPGVEVLGTHMCGRNDPGDLLDMLVTHRRRRATVTAVVSPVTTQTPPASLAPGMPFTERRLRPVVLCLPLRVELKQRRPVVRAVQQGLAAPAARLPCLHFGPANVPPFTYPLLPPFSPAQLLFLCRLRCPARPQQRPLFPLPASSPEPQPASAPPRTPAL